MPPTYKKTLHAHSSQSIERWDCDRLIRRPFALELNAQNKNCDVNLPDDRAANSVRKWFNLIFENRKINCSNVSYVGQRMHYKNLNQLNKGIKLTNRFIISWNSTNWNIKSIDTYTSHGHGATRTNRNQKMKKYEPNRRDDGFYLQTTVINYPFLTSTKCSDQSREDLISIISVLTNVYFKLSWHLPRVVIQSSIRIDWRRRKKKTWFQQVSSDLRDVARYIESEMQFRIN